jgi:peptidoglycan/xylan/chitin deacetylase (PgdA/CDA1 family)
MKTVLRSARWLRSRLVDGALILGYHRVAESPRDPFALSVTPQHFAEHLDILGQHAYPIHLQELVAALRRGTLPRRAVVLTFDDGYADNLYTAKPLLERYQIPATVFVTTGHLGREFWWDALARSVLLPATFPFKLRLLVRGTMLEWDLGGANNRHGGAADKGARLHLLLALQQRLSALEAEERRRVLDQLDVWSGVEATACSFDRALTPDELLQLDDGGLIEIGSHTVTHPILAALAHPEQQREIHQSKTHLETILGKPVMSFSYPHGAVSDATADVVQEAGFSCACMSYNDIARLGSDRFRLPRFWIPDANGEAFSRWLYWWLRT